jgi:DNA-binding transcriptional ArsR family regulator
MLSAVVASRGSRVSERAAGRPPITTAEPVALPEHELLARMFRTLGDYTRLRVLERLAEVGEASQRELVDHAGVPQPRMSEHLSCLEWCGFVIGERHGRTVRYRLADGFAEDFLGLARGFLADNANAVGCCIVLDDEERAESP